MRNGWMRREAHKQMHNDDEELDAQWDREIEKQREPRAAWINRPQQKDRFVDREILVSDNDELAEDYRRLPVGRSS